ncbi:MAG: hypothetical protein KAU95_03915, partial [Candidatus Aenigmarchaeota archaeon]|nr:hypothetical protein [Candidatus Aenigmarchaeota archaeon]
NYFSNKGIDLDRFNEFMKELEKKMKKEKQSFIIKDRKGLIISLGLPKKHLNSTKWISFPEAYPYNCQYKETPIFSRGEDNMRIKFVFCCQKILDCGDYISTAGRAECPNDPCAVGPGAGSCKFYYCKSNSDEQKICLDKKRGTRVCIDDEPPEIYFTARFKGDSEWEKQINITFEKEDVEVEFKLDIYESEIKQIIINYGMPGERPEPLEPDKLDKETIKKGSKEGVRYFFSHVYGLPLEYTVIVEVVDKGGNKDEKEIEICLKE